MLSTRQLHLEGRHNVPGDLILHREDIFQHPVIALGPQVRAGRRVDELGRNADPLGRFAHTALQHIPHAEILTHLLHLHGLPLIGKHRRTRNHEHAGNLGEGRDEILGHAIAEILLLRVVTQVRQREHGDGRLVRECERRPHFRQPGGRRSTSRHRPPP